MWHKETIILVVLTASDDRILIRHNLHMEKEVPLTIDLPAVVDTSLCFTSQKTLHTSLRSVISGDTGKDSFFSEQLHWVDMLHSVC